MKPAVHDYETLKREFITSDISIRGLCAKHNIKSYSVVAKYAREHGWYDERTAIADRKRDRMVERAAERLADAEVDEMIQFRQESLTVIRAALYKFAEDLRNPDFKVKADELAKLVQLGLLLSGSPTERIEERRLDVHASFNDVPSDILRRLVDETRPRPIDARAALPDSRTGPEGARAN